MSWVDDATARLLRDGDVFTIPACYIVNPDPRNPKPQLLSGYWRHVGEFVRFEHICPGEGCAIARLIREHASTK